MAPPQGTVDGFWQKVERTPGCWPWNGLRLSTGYGQVTVGRKRFSTHRLAWQLVNGPIPDGLSVLHACDNRLCVRPDHLFLGTQADNIRDMVAKNRQAKGERNSQARLTAVQVAEIKARFGHGETQTEISKAFGVSLSAIHLIVRNKHWKDGAVC